MSQISKQLDYKKETYVHSNYKLTRVLQQTNGQQYVIGPGGGYESIFEIPVKALNFAQSYLYFSITPPILNAPTYAADRASWFFTDCVASIQQIQLQNRGGIPICDLNYVSNYTKVVNKVETPMGEYLNKPTIQDTLITNQSVGEVLGKSNALADSNTRTAVSPYARRFNNSVSSVHYREPKYLEPGSAVANASPVLAFNIPLSAFKNTILALDKTIYFGEIVLLRIVWNNTNRIAFAGTSITDPTAANSGPYLSPLTLNNLTLYLAVEKSPEIVNQLRTQIASPGGMQILIPFVYYFKTAPGLGSTHTLQYKFNRGQGINLKRIYVAPFNITETGNVAYDHDNLTGNGKVNVFYTMMDNERLQEFDISVAQNLDYQYMYQFLKDSVVQDANIYRHNWFWIEDFSDRAFKDDKDNLLTGLDLSIERKYEFYATLINNGVANANYNYYTWAITQKMLTVSSAGITVA